MSDWISETLYDNGTLINKLGIKDKAQLAQKEFEITAQREIFLLDQRLKINSINDLNKIHEFLFSPLYDWAGKLRPGNFAKGNTVFFDYSRFSYAQEDIDHLLLMQRKKRNLETKDYAELMDLINYMHPFREGNGRSTRLFLQCYAYQHGQLIDYPLSNDGLIAALNEADTDKIAELIRLEIP